MADYARRIAARNGLSSDDGGPVAVVAGKVEDLQELPGGLKQVLPGSCRRFVMKIADARPYRCNRDIFELWTRSGNRTTIKQRFLSRRNHRVCFSA